MNSSTPLALFLAISSIGAGIFSPLTAFAQSTQGTSTVSPQAQCFSTLKENMAETTLFSDPLAQLGTMTYAQLQPQFSKNYKEMQSFGIEINKPALEMRVYSFGQQTGYVHPPELPFPSSYKSDTWVTPSKEFIIAEEYAVDGNNTEHFINCSFMQIRSDDLLKVTRDRYLYDGAMISLAKTAPDGSYKAWYSQNTSFDYQDKPFVDWLRLFVYPKSTQNSFFDKYDVADAFPANTVASFDVLKFFLQNLISVQTYDQTGAVQMKYLVANSTGTPVETPAPQALEPVTPTGIDQTFPLATYYQAIENQFPEFGKLLALRGTLQYDTFKQLASEKNLNPEVGKLLSALVDYRQLATYSFDKQNTASQGAKMSNPAMDGLLLAVSNADLAVQELASGKVTLATLTKLTPTPTPDTGTKNWWWIAGGAITGVLLVAALAFLFWRKRQTIVTDL